MSEISKDQVLHNVKEAYKQVSGDTSSITYGNLPEKIQNLPVGNGWIKPADWPDINSYTDDIVLLVSDEYPTVCFTVQAGTGTGTIDWGDGSATTTFTNSSSTKYSHTYGASSTGGILLANGHKAYIIKMNRASNNIIRFRIQNPDNTTSIFYQSWLWLKINTNKITETAYMCYKYDANVNKIASTPITLEYIDLSKCTAMKTFQYAFDYCENLQEVKLPDTLSSCTTWHQAFYRCPRLKKIVVPEMRACANFNRAFAYCGGLKEIEFKGSSYPEVTTTDSMFYGAGGDKIVLPSFPKNTACTSMFSSWCGIELIATGELVSETTATATAFNSFLNGAICAKKIDLGAATIPDTVTTFSAFIGSNNNLKELIFPQGGKKWGGTIGTGAYLFPNSSYALEHFTIPSTWFSESTATMTVEGAISGFNIQTIDTECGLNMRKFTCSGASNAMGRLTSITLPSANSQYLGGAPQITLNYQALSQQAIHDLIYSLPTLSGKSLSLVGCAGAPSAADIAEAASRGWSIVT